MHAPEIGHYYKKSFPGQNQDVWETALKQMATCEGVRKKESYQTFWSSKYRLFHLKHLIYIMDEPILILKMISLIIN